MLLTLLRYSLVLYYVVEVVAVSGLTFLEWAESEPLVWEYMMSLSGGRDYIYGGNRKACANILKKCCFWTRGPGESGRPHGGEFAGKSVEELPQFLKHHSFRP